MYCYLLPSYGVKRKVLKILKPIIVMCTGLSFVIRFHKNVTNRISETAQNEW